MAEESPLMYCDWPEIAGCENIDPETGACLECEDGCYWNGNQCKLCSLGKCSQCEETGDYATGMYPTCLECEDGFALTKRYYHGDKMKPQLVCDFEFSRRALHCLASDLESDGGCEMCETGRFFDHLSSSC